MISIVKARGYGKIKDLHHHADGKSINYIFTFPLYHVLISHLLSTEQMKFENGAPGLGNRWTYTVNMAETSIVNMADHNHNGVKDKRTIFYLI